MVCEAELTLAKYVYLHVFNVYSAICENCLWVSWMRVDVTKRGCVVLT
jgi:hypothetical protein